MRIKALRTMRGDAGNIRRDAEADVSDAVGKSLVARGLAEEVEVAEAPKKRRRPHVKARAAPKAEQKKPGE